MAQNPTRRLPLPYVALLLAWILPGAGHVYLGRVRRGIILCVTIGATFWAGVAIGGVLTVDYQNERWWFVAEMFTGVHGLVGWYRQEKVYQEMQKMGPAEREQHLAARGLALVAPTATVAQAYAGIAGLLNLMCMFDAVLLALMGIRGEPPPQDHPQPGGTPP